MLFYDEALAQAACQVRQPLSYRWMDVLHGK
jgi:hypothetical protein